MSHSLCNRCEHYSGCLLNFDGKPCRKLRSVEPTNYDRIMEMDAEQLASFNAEYSCPPGKEMETCPNYAMNAGIGDLRDVFKRKCTACWLEYLNTETKEDLG